MKAKILYVGDLWTGSTAQHRLEALSEIADCEAIDSTPVIRNAVSRSLFRAGIKFGFQLDFAGVNKRILNRIDRGFDILWIDKGLNISPQTVSQVKKTNPTLRLVFYSPDDMSNPANQSVQYLRSIPLYDLHVTTKSYNVTELKALGAKDVLFVGNGYSQRVHKPMVVLPEERKKWGSDIGFIGSWEQERFEMIRGLTKRNLSVKVIGDTWARYEHKMDGLEVVPVNAWDVDYARVLNVTKINLCFLKKGNRDLQTTRSVEIPACGAFMLAERTDEHLSLFEEDKEAAYFSSADELFDKTVFYLKHEALRKTIAAAGRNRCIVSGYSNRDRLSAVLNHLNF